MDPWTHTHEYSLLMQCLCILIFLQTMYALEIISKYLRDNEYIFEYHAETLISTLELLRKVILSSLEMSTRNKSLARPRASPQLHSGLQSTREYTKMNAFPSGQIMLDLSGVLLMMDVQFGTNQLILWMKNPMSDMMTFKQWSTTTKVLLESLLICLTLWTFWSWHWQYCLMEKSKHFFWETTGTSPLHPATLKAPSRSFNLKHFW